MKFFNGLRLTCLHCAEALYVNKALNIKKRKREYASSAGKKKNLCNFLLLRWEAKMVKHKMPVSPSSSSPMPVTQPTSRSLPMEFTKHRKA